ncbi:MAG: phosphoribosylformylglycinamidine synthase subunit PurL [Patescibacteria group bacterium]
MIATIRIASSGKTDSKGQELLAEIKRTFKNNSITSIKTSKVYRLEGISQRDVKKLAEKALYEPIDQIISYRKPIYKANKTVEVAYKPGVMNPEVASITKAASDLGIKLLAADSSYEYAFFGKVNENLISEIINKLLVNKTVEHIVKTPPKTLVIGGEPQKTKIIPIRKLNDLKLMQLSKDKLFLNLEEMKIIRAYFQKINRDPTDCEIEILAQTWSEHCVHKTFNAKLTIDGKLKKPLFERIKSTAKNNKKIIISAFVDNSGVIDFYDGYAINGKVETHNSPSAIEPYGGAMTGSGGVFRDILGTGQGAKPIISTDIFCFANPDMDSINTPPGCLPPAYLLRRVVAGVRDYGNRVGIPTNNGSIHFHNDFRAKPTVAVGSYGVLPKKSATKKEPQIGDLIITMGGATGRDGIHGATFSSAEMSDKTMNISGSAVQIGNAIEEKRVIDAILIMENQNLISSITDCGAGGFSSAVGEMAKKTGAEIQLAKVPLKYPNLAPWEIFLSESQERMVIAISGKNLKNVEKICDLYNVPFAQIGKITNSNKLIINYKKEMVANLSMQFLHNGLPQRHMVGRSKSIKINEELPKKIKDYESIIKKIISHPNIASKEPIVRMYDHNVQGTTALYPFSGADLDAPNDGVAIKPMLSKPYGVITTHGLNPVLNNIDIYWGSIWALTEAVSNYVAIGGDLKDAALIDNFIWPFPDEESLADLDKSVDACVDFANLLKMPFVSGKDSLSSTYRYPDGKTLKIPPVLLISVFGKIPDVSKTISSDFKSTNSIVVLVGKSDLKNLGGTIYFDITGSKSAKIPQVDLKLLPKVLSTITASAKSGKILSIHDISEGGLISAISEMCFGGACGASIDLSQIDKKTRSEFILFSETPGTFLLEVKDEKATKSLFSKIPHKIIGKTQKEKTIKIKSGKKQIVSISVDKLKQVWQKPMKEIFHS